MRHLFSRERFERRHEPLLPAAAFAGRLFRSALLASAVLLVSLLIGVVGYRTLAGFDWLDSLFNASMILGGMGPADPIKTTSGKLFASAYAIFCGIVLIMAVGLFLAPLVHRMMHRFHLPLDDDKR